MRAGVRSVVEYGLGVLHSVERLGATYAYDIMPGYYLVPDEVRAVKCVRIWVVPRDFSRPIALLWTRVFLWEELCYTLKIYKKPFN